MKKILPLGLLLALITLSAPAFAGWADSISAAVKSGNFTQVNVIAAKNPEAQSEIALLLLKLTQDNLDNPEKAAKIFLAAQPFVAQIPPPDKAGDAAALIRKIEDAAKEANYQQKDCRGAITILGVALNMSSLPNIVAASPDLHADILSDANDAMEKNPACDTKDLQDQISLAQQPITPTVTVLGAPPPSAD